MYSSVSTVRQPTCSKVFFAAILCAATFLSCGNGLKADDQGFDLPLPQPTANAAVHYQRGLLFLYAVDPAKRELLNKPIWKSSKDFRNQESLPRLTNS